MSLLNYTKNENLIKFRVLVLYSCTVTKQRTALFPGKFIRNKETVHSIVLIYAKPRAVDRATLAH